jgi:hypothetical protein
MISPVSSLAGLAAALLIASPVAAAERRFDVSGFQKVAASGSDDVVITSGDRFSVVADGPENWLDRLEIKVEGDTLKIGQKKRWFSMTVGDTKIRITMPVLTGLSLAGSGSITADKASGPAFVGSISGSGDIRIAALDADSVRLGMSGSGDIMAAGRCSTAKIGISGSGDVDISGLKCADVDIGISGSGDVNAFASRKAKIGISGSGDVQIKGGGKCEIRTSGSGEVTCA